MTTTPLPATVETFGLAEGPLWDPHRGRLLWVDITAGVVLEGRLNDHTVVVSARHDFGGTVGAVSLSDDGTMLIAAQRHLVVVHPDGTLENGPMVIPADERRRLNDGATDPAGRFLAGTLSIDEGSEHEVLVRLEPDGTLTTLDDDLTLSNGLAWTMDGKSMYNVDTGRGIVFVRSYDPTTGQVGVRRPHLEIDGSPDGIATDQEDHLWVAVWGAGEVRRYSPDGAIVDSLTIPAPHTSSVAFAGDDLRTLVITTASDELDDDQLRKHPDSGRLFLTRVEVPGRPTPPWSGPVGTT